MVSDLDIFDLGPLWQADGVEIAYAPKPDGRPDPGEVVWTWVPYEDDPSRGKDRPVLLVGREGEQLFGLMMTSQDHDLDQEQEAREGRHWLDIGPGPWDSEGRPSEIRLDRLITIDPETVRREGSVIDQARFESVAAALTRYLP